MRSAKTRWRPTDGSSRPRQIASGVAAWVLVRRTGRAAALPTPSTTQCRKLAYLRRDIAIDRCSAAISSVRWCHQRGREPDAQIGGGNINARPNTTIGIWPFAAGTTMPVDAAYQAESKDTGGAPVYIGALQDAAGVRTLARATLHVHPSSATGQPATFVTTIPVASLGQPLATQARVLLEAGVTLPSVPGSFVRWDLAPSSGPLPIKLS